MIANNLLKKVKQLREITGVGFKDCKSAIEEAKGDIKKAIELMDRASQFLPDQFMSLPSEYYPHGQEHKPRQDLLDCLDSVCAYLEVLEKKEEEENE